MYKIYWISKWFIFWYLVFQMASIHCYSVVFQHISAEEEWIIFVQAINCLNYTLNLSLKWWYYDYTRIIVTIWNLLEMQIQYPRLIEFETLRRGPSNLCFSKSSLWFWFMLKFDNHCTYKPRHFPTLWLLSNNKPSSMPNGKSDYH